MTFKDLHLDCAWAQIKKRINFINELVRDKRLRTSIILFIVSCIIILSASSIYLCQKAQLTKIVVKLDTQTQEIMRHIAIKQQQANIPQFEASMKSMGAYKSPLPPEICLSHITYCFLQKNKPQIDMKLIKQEVDPTFTIQSFNLQFKSSFDYEIFDMLEYIFSTPSKFGYTRLREFEIEQLFETSPVVKGQFVYDQLSLAP